MARHLAPETSAPTTHDDAAGAPTTRPEPRGVGPETAPEPGAGANPHTATELAVDLRDITKRFGRSPALTGVDLQIPRGVIAGFLGPNGAGKSTTIRVLLGLLRADAGTATVLGHDAWHDAVALHRRLAYVPGDVNLWPGLTGGECLDVLGRMRGGLDRARVQELTERFELDPRKKSRAYSKGNRQKVALIAALAADVELLVLDEPTSGLDPLMERQFQEVLRQRRAEGVSVLLSSHILSEVEHVCDTVAIIRDGAVVEQGTLEQMRHLSRVSLHAVTREDPRAVLAAELVASARDRGPETDPAASAEESALTEDLLTEDLGARMGVHELSVQRAPAGFVLRGGVDHEQLDRLLPALHALEVRHLEITPASLEDVFMRHYRTQPAAGSASEAAGTSEAPEGGER